MDLDYSSTPFLPSHSGLTSQLLLLQFLNQLRTHHNVTTQHTAQAVQNCVHSLKQEEKRRKELINQHEEDYSKLSGDYFNLQNAHLSTEKRIQDLEETFKESSKNCEDKISALERQVEKENLTRIVCESEAKLQKAYNHLEQLNKELHEMRNGQHSDDGKINQVLATLQLIYQNQNNEKDIYLLQNHLSVTKETLENCTEMYTTQRRVLEDEEKKTQGLEDKNGKLEIYLHNLEKQQDEQNQKFEAKLQTMAEELQKKTEELKNMDEQLTKKEEQLKKKDDELKKMDEQLKNKDDELKKKDEQLKNKNEQLTKKDEELRTKGNELDEKEKKAQEIQRQLKSCNQLLNAAKEETAVARKHVTKAVGFTNQYRKYLASGNFNFAIAVYGDTEIKDIFRPSEDIFGKQMTNQEAYKNGFSCGNDRYIPNCFKCDGTDDCGNRNDERNCSTAVFPLGARVVRGPDWKWKDQDGDPPGVGTIINELHQKYERWSMVKWDNGHENGYRVGGEEKIDLRAAAGYFCGAS